MSRGKKIWQAGWRAGVCLVLLGWLFNNIFLNEGKAAAQKQHLSWERLTRWEQWRSGWKEGPAELWHNLSEVDAGAFGLSVLLMGSTLLIGVARWRTVLRVQGLGLPWGRALEISFVAHFFNSFLLGATGGDLMKAYYAARETHHKKTEAVITVLVDRLIGLWAMLLFAALMMLPNRPVLFAHDRLRSLAALILVMLALCSAVALTAFWGGVSRGWAGARRWLRRLPRGDWLERSLDSCRQFGKANFFVSRTVGLSMLLNAACVLQVWVLSRGMNLDISPLALALIVPMIICISAVPITPSGLGVRENLFVFMLADPSIHVPATSALSLSLLAYAGSLIWSLIGGIVYLTLKERHHLTEEELLAKTEG